MKMPFVSYVMLAALLLVSTQIVSAELLDFTFTGKIVGPVEDPEHDFPNIEEDDPFTGYFRYDTDWPEVGGGADPTYGVYLVGIDPPEFPLSFQVEGHTFQVNPEWPTDILVSNDDTDDVLGGPFDEVGLFAPASEEQPAAKTWPRFDGLPIEFGMILNSSDTSVLTDTSLPRQFDVGVWDTRFVFFSALNENGELIDIVGEIETIQAVPAVRLQAGDADQDLDFDAGDVVKVMIAGKFLSGRPATWGEGDWDAAPGGRPGHPPLGNGVFDQFDIIATQLVGIYLTGPYAAVRPAGQSEDAQTSIVYDAGSGELAVDAPAGVELTSINIDSAAGIFTGASAENLGGSFDNDADNNIFKATFGASFGSISFGSVAQAGLSEEFLLDDLTVVGSLQGGGALGDVDLIYVPVPEPPGLVLVLFAAIAVRRLRTKGRG